MANENSEFKVLFVDNSRTMRASMAKVLEQQGFVVETAGSGQEAIDMVQTGQFSIVVMDLFMPQMNGYEAAKAIRDLSDDTINQIPIVALTASDSDSDIQISKDAGMNEFLVKCSDHSVLFETLQKYQTAG